MAGHTEADFERAIEHGLLQTKRYTKGDPKTYDPVTALVDHTRHHGAGRNYLIQYSAGSGKSNSIAWLAHRLASLHDTNDEKVFHSVVVITDRTVLNQQLKNTIYQFEHKTGVVEKIDETMYVVKKLAGVQAVQTLSRLNRIATGKTRTFVLDFKNEEADIFKAFKPYFEATPVGENADPQKLNELHHELLQTAVFTPAEITEFSEVWFKKRREPTGQDHRIMNAVLDRAIERFMNLEEPVQEEFRGQLTAFRNLYSFL